MSERVAVIVNPAAGRGRGGRMLPELTRIFGELGVTDIRQTRYTADETDIATAMIEDGATTIVVVGGDGTIGNTANAILSSGRDVRMAVLPAGTGNDFAKTLGTAKASIRSVAEASIVEGNARADVGRIEDRYFMNCAGFGFDVSVLENIGSNSWLRGNSVYLVTALQQLMSYRGTDLSVRANGNAAEHQRVMILVIANSPWFGGMFRIAPDASVLDGMLDAIAIRDLPLLRRVSVLAAVANGTHSTFSECTLKRAESFEVSFAAPPSYETDGELHHAKSNTLTVSCLPAALRVVSLHNLS